MKKSNNEILAEYISTLLSWVYDTTRRGQEGKRRRIKKLGDELVSRGLLTQEKADAYYRGEVY